MRTKQAIAQRRRLSNLDTSPVDRSLIAWMLGLTPRQRLEVLEGHRRLVRALRRDRVHP
jgi:hypothetical protein